MLQVFCGEMMGDKIAVIFVLCHFFAGNAALANQGLTIINFSWFAWRKVKHVTRKSSDMMYHVTQESFQQFFFLPFWISILNVFKCIL